MKKLLLSLGTAVTMVAPVATVVACGDESSALKKPSYDAETQMLINDIPEYTYHSGQFGSSRTEAIQGVWEEIKTTAGSAKEVAEIITAAAYPETVESIGWEAAVESTLVSLLGGETEYGTVTGWAYAESQRLEKDILFANLEDTVTYEVINTDEIEFETGVDAGYVAKDGEKLINDWDTFNRHSGIGDDATAKINAVWPEIKDKIISKQGFTNYVGYYGYGYPVNNHSSSFLTNIDLWLKDNVSDNGTNIAFKDGTVIDSTINLSIADADAFFQHGGYSVADNGDGTNTVTLGTVTGLELSSSDSLTDVVPGATVTITANAAQGYTINGGNSEDFTIIVAAAQEVSVKDIDFVAISGIISGDRVTSTQLFWHRTDWEISVAGIADGSITDSDAVARETIKPVTEAVDVQEFYDLLSQAAYGNDGQASETGNAGKWLASYQLTNNVVLTFA